MIQFMLNKNTPLDPARNQIVGEHVLETWKTVRELEDCMASCSSYALPFTSWHTVGLPLPVFHYFMGLIFSMTQAKQTPLFFQLYK